MRVVLSIRDTAANPKLQTMTLLGILLIPAQRRIWVAHAIQSAVRLWISQMQTVTGATPKIHVDIFPTLALNITIGASIPQLTLTKGKHGEKKQMP